MQHLKSNELNFGFATKHPSQDELALLTQLLLNSDPQNSGPTAKDIDSNSKNTSPSSPLAGRRMLSRASFASLGDFVIKTYERGGVWRFLVRHHYWGSNECRAEKELNTLLKVSQFGVNVPEPVGFARTTGFLYRNWLFMREIKGAASIAQLAETQDVSPFLDQFIKQVRILVDHKLLHVDLHPGNVLVDGQHKVYLIDFDKACEFKGSASNLRRAYICRWRRAVIKHKLPELLSEYVSAGLLQKEG